MLAWRLVLGPALIALLAALFALDAAAGTRAWVLLGLALCLAVRATWELCDLVSVRAATPTWGLLAGLNAAVIASNWLPAEGGHARLGWSMLTLGLAAGVLFLKGVFRYRASGSTLETLGAELLTLCYVGLFFSLTLQLRWVSGGSLGYLPLASLLVVTKCGDSMAFFAGRRFGRHKMSPLVSPGKTWEGAAGALLGAAAGGWAWLHFGTRWLTSAAPGRWHWLLIYGLLLGLAGMAGDLAESVIKRDAGRKDSASLLPGFGGLLDLLDSVIFTGPVALLLWQVLPLVSS
jgi:phosphatidate cytidylyltransferase